MTRFQIVAIFNDKILTAGEFNGDDYFEDGHGEEICAAFPSIKTEEDYRKMVKNINDQYFKYEEELIHYVGNSEICDIFNFQKQNELNLYYDYWFSDYLYIINLSEEDHEIIDENGEKITLKLNGWVTLNFGKLYKQNDPEYKIKCMSNVEITQNFDNIKGIIENEGWKISENDDNWEIGKYTPAGEDFWITVFTNEDIAAQVKRESENFDPDEHVAMWVKNYDTVSGIPSVRELIEDAEWIEAELINLAYVLNK